MHVRKSDKWAIAFSDTMLIVSWRLTD